MAHLCTVALICVAAALFSSSCQAQVVQEDTDEGAGGDGPSPSGTVPSAAAGAAGDELDGTGAAEANGGEPAATGGRRPTGGAAGTAGEVASGGVVPTSGRANTGGELPAGGEGATGGRTSPGGRANTGGEGAAGGRTVAGAAGQGGACHIPTYSTDCSEVTHFQCGFEPWCDGNVLHVSWHEHVTCYEWEIVEFECSYPCAEECNLLTAGWPEDGTNLVDRACFPAGGGPRRVFVTSTEMPGDFGSIAAGDAICQGLADSQALGGTWMAWLSDGESSPATRFTRSSAGYVELDESIFAMSWSDLVWGDVNTIRVDETGNTVPSDAMVWTGTDGAGETAEDTCDAWQSTTAVGAVGEAYSSIDWTIATAQDCSVPAHLYCFEQ